MTFCVYVIAFPRKKIVPGNAITFCYITCYVVHSPKSLTICLTTFILMLDASALS